MSDARLDQRPTALLVLGMHRSGTSALTGTLGLLGVDLGHRLIDPGPDNRKGYWEHADAVLAHEALLQALDSAWDDVDPLPADWRDRSAVQQAKAAIGQLIDSEFADSPLWLVKDPRLCRLLPIWLDVLASRGIRPALLYMVRHPAEIAASLETRDYLHPEASALLTLRYLLEAGRAGHDCDRAVLSYDELMGTPEAALGRLASELKLAWPVSPSNCSDAIRSFLDPGDRHHRVQAAPDHRSAGRLDGLAEKLHAVFLDIAAGSDRWHEIDDLDKAMTAAVGARNQADIVIELHRLCSRRARRVAAKAASMHAELRARLIEDEAAIQRLEQLSLDRLDESTRLARQLADTEQALARTDRLSLDRMNELQRLSSQLADTEQALARTEELSFDRLNELQRLSSQLADTERALAVAERLSLERLVQIEELDRALGAVTQLSLDRLAQIEQMAGQITEAERILSEACRTSLGHLDEISGLDARAAVTAEAIRELAEQSLSQRQRIQILEAAEQALAVALASEHARREAMERSLSWRITAPLRYLNRVNPFRRPLE